MKLYMHPISTTSRPVRLFVAEHQIPVEEQVVDIMTGAQYSQPYAAVNPNCLVPMLEDGDLRLTESSAILKYLADKVGSPAYPKDLKQRAKVNEVMDWIKDADKKIGLCMDVGHTFRCGVSPAEMAVKYASRLYDIHIKDQADATKTGRGVPVGQGVIDVIGLLKTLIKTKYAHHVALEYEVEANNPIPGIGESIGFERGVLAVL